jgi:hypothetical protein
VVRVDDVASELDDSPYRLAVWPQEPIRTRRYLGFADLINVRGVRVSASAATIASSLSDYRELPFTSSLTNGSCSPAWIIFWTNGGVGNSLAVSFSVQPFRCSSQVAGATVGRW